MYHCYKEPFWGSPGKDRGAWPDVETIAGGKLLGDHNLHEHSFVGG